MITAAVSALMGIFGGLVPDIMKEVRESRDHKREMERMDRQADIQIKLAQAKAAERLQEVGGNLLIEDLRAEGERIAGAIRAGSQRSGVRWVDGFNAFVRPFAAVTAWVLFLGVASMYAVSVISNIESMGDLGGAAVALWGSMLGEVIQGVLGYLFGYRTSSASVDVARQMMRSRA